MWGLWSTNWKRALATLASAGNLGKPVGKFESVANRIADMKIRLETARLILYKVAWLKKRWANRRSWKRPSPSSI